MDDERELDALTGRVAAQMKEPVPVRAGWREQLLLGIERDRAPRRSLAATLPWALAAGILGVIAGFAGDRALSHRDLPIIAAASNSSSVRFVFVAPTAARVSLAGDFNEWRPDAAPMHRLADGRTWVVDLPLAAGRYGYTFVVDGRMVPDPAAPVSAGDDFGVRSSILLVSAR